MTKYFILALLSCALMFGGDKPASQNAEALKKCTDGCTNRYNACKKTANSKSAATACEKSRDICRGSCNK